MRCALLIGLICIGASLSAIAGAGEPIDSVVRHTGLAFGQALVAEIVTTSETAAEVEQAAHRAFEKARQVESLVDPQGAGLVARLNVTRGLGSEPVSETEFQLLARALDFCQWSNGAFGPLGGRLNNIWGVSRPASGIPTEPRQAAARQAASCDRLVLDRAEREVALAADSLVDLRGFARGYSLDQVAESLRNAGFKNLHLQLGSLHLAMGDPPGGRGWTIQPPTLPGQNHALKGIVLRDQSLAIASFAERPIQLGGDLYSNYINHKSGRPATGVVAVVAVTDLAIDAQALATTMFVTGSREGRFRLGVLSPRPAVLWLLGSGRGAPVFTNFHWSSLRDR